MDQIPIFFLLSLPLVGAFALFAIGIVVIYQASRVLNLAHGAMAMVPAYLTYELWRHGVPPLPASGLGIASGALLGALIERVFVRMLGRQSATAQTVGTVAAFGLLMSVAIKVWGTTPRSAAAVFPEGGIPVGAATLQWGEIGLFAVAAIVAAALVVTFKYTDVGMGMRAAADNPRAAGLMGIDPDWTTRLAWMLGGGLAGLAGILLAGATILHPVNLSLLVLPGFVAALIGGLGSLTGALAGAAVVGLVQGLVPAIALIPGLGSFASQVGASQLVLTIVALLVMVLRGERFVGATTRAEDGVAVAAPAGLDRRRRMGSSQAGRERRLALRALLGVALVSWPLLGVPFSILGDAIQACIILLVAVSLILLTGWVGQISLAQAGFVGLGAFTTALLANRADLSFPLNLPVAATLAAGAAALLGLIALRVRGLYLAVATLIFLWMANEYLFRASWLVGTGGGASIENQEIGEPGAIPFFDLSDRRSFYYIALAVAAATLWAVANLRDSRTGRAFYAVRGSEVAAASLGIDVTRYKLLAFALSGFLAGAAGNLMIIGQGATSASQFTVNASLFYLSVAVVGGLTSLGGAVAASILFAGLNEVFFRVQALAGWLDIVSAGLLAFVLLAYPGGLARLPASLARARAALRDRILPESGLLRRRIDPVLESLGWLLDALTERVITRTRRLRLLRIRPAATSVVAEAASPSDDSLERSSLTEAEPPTPDASLADASGESRSASFPWGASPVVASNGDAPGHPSSEDGRRATRPVLEVESLTVRFGGLVAADNVSLSVRAGEIVGLIGPNGAGKTTVFNAVSGLNVPSAGTVRLLGEDATNLPPHQRAAMGVARTFQVIQLFGGLTVFGNLLVATHLQDRTGTLSHLAVTAPALEAEDAARLRVRAAIEVFGLEDVADRPVAGLPFGTLRMVELARTVVARAPLVMLDEPASGLDNAETDQLARLLRFIRDELDVSMLLIEHDVRMVTSVSDYMYVLDQGRLLAEGLPATIQDNEQVIAAYLGAAAVAQPTSMAGSTR